MQNETYLNGYIKRTEVIWLQDDKFIILHDKISTFLCINKKNETKCKDRQESKKTCMNTL